MSAPGPQETHAKEYVFASLGFMTLAVTEPRLASMGSLSVCKQISVASTRFTLEMDGLETT